MNETHGASRRAPGPSTWGALRVGGLTVALPLEALRELVPCGELRVLPPTARGVIGARELRGSLVPVIDLAQALGLPGAEATGATRANEGVIALALHGGRVIGLRVDAAADVFEADAATLCHADAAAGGQPLLLAGSLRRAGGVVAVLDLARLLALPGVPTIEDPEPERATLADAGDGNGSDETSSHTALMLLRCAGVALAFEAALVDAAIVSPQVQPSPLRGGACRGVVEHAGRRIAAVDLLAWCGLGAQAPETLERAIVVHVGSGRVALLVAEVQDVVRCASQQLLPLAGWCLPRPELFGVALPAPQGEGPSYLVLQRAAVEADDTLLALAATNVEGAGGEGVGNGVGAGAAAAANGEPMITYELDTEVATPIGQVLEILGHRPRAQALQAGAALLDIRIERGRSIPVFALARACGVAAAPLGADARVLVVDAGHGPVGFAVPALRTIEAAQGGRELPGPAGTQRVAFFGRGSEQRTLRVIDLQALARGLAQAGLSSDPRRAA